MAKKIKAITYKQITGVRRDIKEEDREDYGKVINSAYNLINFETGKVLGDLNRSLGFELLIDTGTGEPVENMNISKDMAGNYFFSAISNGNLFSIIDWDTTPSINNTLSGLNTGYVDIVEANLPSGENVLILFDRLQPKKYNFSSITDLLTSTTFNASTGTYINDRAWMDDLAQPGLIRFSKGGDIQDCDTLDNAGFLPIGSNSQPIKAIKTLFIPKDNASAIFIAKENECHGVSGKSGDSAAADRFSQYPINLNVAGTGSPRGMLTIGQDLLIIGRNQIYQYGSLNSTTGVISQQEIFDPVINMYNSEFNLDELSDAFIFYNSNEGFKGRIYFFLPANKSTKNNRCLVLDRSRGWFTRNWNQFSFKSAVQDPVTKEVYFGDYKGRIYKMNSGYTYAGNPYTSTIDFGYCTFGSTGDGKTTIPSMCKASFNASQNIDLKFKYMKRTRLGMFSSNEEIISLRPIQSVYNVNLYDETLMSSEDQEQTKNLYIPGTFQALNIQVSTDSLVSGVNVSSIEMGVESKDG
jgi:hypothetical protein